LKTKTIEDRPRKITANDDKALGQWIRRNNETTSQELIQKTTSLSRSECVQMDSATSTQTNGLQKYFAAWNTNVNTEAQRSTCSMGNPTSR
ncbi:unnamed protein product, partial [Rotaria socialis]